MAEANINKPLAALHKRMPRLNTKLFFIRSYYNKTLKSRGTNIGISAGICARLGCPTHIGNVGNSVGS